MPLLLFACCGLVVLRELTYPLYEVCHSLATYQFFLFEAMFVSHSFRARFGFFNLFLIISYLCSLASS